MDLSAMHIKFSIQNADEETPNTASIRVYNLSKETFGKIRGEFSQVVLNAGYENGNYGVIFQGTIKQYRIGRENATDTYLDILAADGDDIYNQAFVNMTLAKGHTPAQELEAISKNTNAPVDISSVTQPSLYKPNIRGTVQFGLARARFRHTASTLNASWSIQNGTVVFLDNTGYLPGQIVKLNSATGLIGLPEQTDGGIKLQCLLNSRLRIGSRVQIDQEAINQTLAADPKATVMLPYNRWPSGGIQELAPLSKDGTYRAFVVEHEGDTRGHAWYSNLICLAVDETAPANQSVSKQ